MINSKNTYYYNSKCSVFSSSALLFLFFTSNSVVLLVGAQKYFLPQVAGYPSYATGSGEYRGSSILHGETRLRRLGHLERVDETNLIIRIREERFPGNMKTENVLNGDEEEKSASMTETNGDDAAEKWSTPVN